MARRYCEGAAIPRPDKLQAIAAWLGMTASELAYGGKSPTAHIDEGLLQRCIESVTEAQARTGKTLTTAKAAQLVALLYREAQTGRIAEPATCDLLVRAA